MNGLFQSKITKGIATIASTYYGHYYIYIYIEKENPKQNTFFKELKFCFVCVCERDGEI